MARHKRTYTGERCTAFLGIKCPPSALAELQAAAAQRGATVSEFARELLFRRAAETVAGTRRNPEAAAIMRALDAAAYQNSGVGNLLNQIARHMHMSGEVRELPELREALAEYQRIGELYEQALARVIAS